MFAFKLHSKLLFRIIQRRAIALKSTTKTLFESRIILQNSFSRESGQLTRLLLRQICQERIALKELNFLASTQHPSFQDRSQGFSLTNWKGAISEGKILVTKL